MYIKSFNEGKKVAHLWMLCLHYKIYSFCLGFDIGLGLDAMALALTLALMVLALLTSPQ